MLPGVGTSAPPTGCASSATPLGSARLRGACCWSRSASDTHGCRRWRHLERDWRSLGETSAPAGGGGCSAQIAAGAAAGGGRGGPTRRGGSAACGACSRGASESGGRPRCLLSERPRSARATCSRARRFCSARSLHPRGCCESGRSTALAHCRSTLRSLTSVAARPSQAWGCCSACICAI